MKKPKIIIIGGHLTPAIAVADEILIQDKLTPIWVGTKFSSLTNKNNSAEYNIVNDRGIKFVNLRTGKLYRKWNSFTLKSGLISLMLIPWGFLKSAKIILQIRPKLIMSFGGYLAVPLAFWGFIFRIPVITHEQTVVTGLANKIVARFASKILISWEHSQKHFELFKVDLVGNPIPDIFKKIHIEEKFKLFDNKLPTIFITGGNQGAHIINEVIESLLPELLLKYNVIHQCGSSDLEIMKTASQDIKNRVGRYVVYDYDLTSKYAKHLKNADLVISRSGANTMSVLFLYRKFSIQIPIPWASQNEQLLNAKILEEANLAFILEEKDLDKISLMKQIERYFRNPPIPNYEKIPKIDINAEKRIVDHINSQLKV